MKNTREKLLENATQMFAEYGFDGISTRDLVAMSGVNLCTINYYFGSKQQLYDAVIDGIIDNINNNLIQKITEYTSQNVPFMDKIVFAMGEFFDYLFSAKVSNYMALIAFRELLTVSDGGNRIYRELLDPLKERFTKLIIDETGMDKQTALITAESLIGPAMVFRLQQNREHYSRGFLAKVKQQIIENCKILLRSKKCQKQSSKK